MDVLFRRHRDFVFRLGWSFTGSRDLAQDVVQEVFARIYKVPLRALIRAQFATWLYRVTVNVAREQKRTANKLVTTAQLPESVDESMRASRRSGHALRAPARSRRAEVTRRA